MSNYPNMSYCMNSNTLLAMKQILSAMEEEGPAFIEELSREEYRAFFELVETAQCFADLAEEYQQEIEEKESYDDSMDGDAESALASAGWGTDEDYGG